MGVELLLTFPRPSSEEINAVRSGEAKFALIAADHALMLCHRFGAQPWQDAPWQAVRQAMGDRAVGLAEGAPDQHLVVQVVLVDGATGIVRALRAVTWPPEFVAAVRTAIERQQAAGGTDQDGERQIAEWYRQYPTTTAAVAAADIIVTGGTD